MSDVAPFVWVTLRTNATAYHRLVTCHAHARTVRVPTVEAAAICAGLTLCVDCAKPQRPVRYSGSPRVQRAASEALAEFANTLRAG